MTDLLDNSSGQAGHKVVLYFFFIYNFPRVRDKKRKKIERES